MAITNRFLGRTVIQLVIAWIEAATRINAIHALKVHIAIGPAYSLGYNYDAVGNRTRLVNGASVTNYTYGSTSNRLNQVNGSQANTIASDANGSITGNGSATFNYDARGRMVSANTAIGLVTYKINALGQRVMKTTPTSNTVYHYDAGGKLIAESTGASLTEYVYLGDLPVAVLK